MANQIEQLEEIVEGTHAKGDFHFDVTGGVLRVNSLLSRWSTSAMVPLLLGILGLVIGVVWYFVAGLTSVAYGIAAFGLLMLAVFGGTFANPGFVIDVAQGQIRYRGRTIDFDAVGREQFAINLSEAELKVVFTGFGPAKLLATFAVEEATQAARFIEHLWRVIRKPDPASVSTYGSRLTPVQWWIQGASAIFTVGWGLPLGEFGDGGGPWRSVGRIGITRALERDWGIYDRDELLAVVDSLVRHGHRENLAAQGVPGDFLIWDYARALWMYRMGHILGWLPESDCWDAMLPLARDIQRHYDSWQDMNHWYLHGRELWAAEAEDNHQARRADTARELAADPRCPWNFLAWNLPLSRDW